MFCALIAGGSIYYAFLTQKTQQPKGQEHSVGGVNPPESPANTYSPPVAPSPQPKPRVQIVNDSFHVGARGFKYFQFTLATSGKVEGAFRAYGGSEDIEVTLVDEDNFVNWKNRVSGRTPFQSGITSRGKIDVVVPPGAYFLVFSNRHALFTNKTVAAEVYVQEL
ncbi:MAG: hypothetical protein AB7V18_11995 [Pyrinomonadaceae bacterium]